MLLGADGPRLADFGIARAMDGTAVTGTGYIVGTAAYLAPEQVRGEWAGPEADVYALGLVLLEALTAGASIRGRWWSRRRRGCTGHRASRTACPRRCTRPCRR